MANSNRTLDQAAVRASLTKVLRSTKLTHKEVAERMTELLGQEVTEQRLYKYSAQSRDDYRWPAEYDIALCEVLGNYSLLEERVKRAGFRLVGPSEERLIQIGREFLRREKADKFLRGVAL